MYYLFLGFFISKTQPIDFHNQVLGASFGHIYVGEEAF
jgi:hypothetical protein